MKAHGIKLFFIGIIQVFGALRLISAGHKVFLVYCLTRHIGAYFKYCQIKTHVQMAFMRTS